MFAGDDKYFHVCNDCLDEMYSHYELVLGGRDQAIYRMCMKFDVYFSESIIKMIVAAKRTFENPFKAYLSKMNLAQVPGVSFDDTLDEESRIGITSVEEIDIANREGASIKVKKVDFERWGPGYTPQEYQMLNTHFKTLTSAATDLGTQESIIRTLCETHVMKERARQNEDVGKYKDLAKLYNEYYTLAGFKKLKGADEMTDQPLGVLVAVAEGIAPAEFYQDKDIFVDVDKFGDYWKRFIIRPFKNLLTGAREMDKEFSVGGENE